MSAAESAAVESSTAATQPKVLVVDDTPHNVKLLADLLGVKGYSVATATNGEEALARIAASGFDAFVTKPINVKSFVETVERFAGKPKG